MDQQSLTKTPTIQPIELTDKAAKILQGAMQEFLAHGYAATSMDKVASAAGVSKATLYSHFGDKEGLFTALVKQLAYRKFSTVFNVQPTADDVEIQLRQMAIAALDQSQEHEHLAFIRLIIGESERFPQLAQTFVQNLTKPGIEFLTHFLASHPELDIPDPEAAARIVIGAIVHFTLTQEILHGKEIIPMDRDRLVDGLMHFLPRCTKRKPPEH